MDTWLIILIIVAVLGAFYIFQRRSGRGHRSDSSSAGGYPTTGENNARQGPSKAARNSNRNDSDSGGGGDGVGGSD